MRRHITSLAVISVLVVIFGTIYAVVQQTQRSDANYPQIQLAEDTAAALNRGDPPLALANDNVNVANSLAPFTIIYDKTGKVYLSSGYLNGKAPKAPLGMLEDSKGKTYNAVTWQPQQGVRIASVTVAAKNYYVLSGRSLTEVEKNENLTFWLAFAGGALSLLIVCAAILAKTVVTGR